MSLSNIVKNKSLPLLINVFIAGASVIIWLMIFVFNPQTKQAQDIAVIKNEIQTIQLNHIKHLEDQGKRIEDMKKEQLRLYEDIKEEQLRQAEKDHELDKRLERLLTIIEQKI